MFVYPQALRRLDEIEVQLSKADLPRNSTALAEQHAALSAAIVEVTAAALREGRILLERAGRGTPDSQGVTDMVRRGFPDKVVTDIGDSPIVRASPTWYIRDSPTNMNRRGFPDVLISGSLT